MARCKPGLGASINHFRKESLSDLTFVCVFCIVLIAPILVAISVPAWCRKSIVRCNMFGGREFLVLYPHMVQFVVRRECRKATEVRHRHETFMSRFG